MVSNHAQAGVGNVLLAGFAHRCFDQRLEQIDFIIGVNMLQHG